MIQYFTSKCSVAWCSLRIETKIKTCKITLRSGSIRIDNHVAFLYNYLTQFYCILPFPYKFEGLVFWWQIELKVGGRGPNVSNDRSQVSSSWYERYENAHACWTQSPKRILPLSYFLLQPGAVTITIISNNTFAQQDGLQFNTLIQHVESCDQSLSKTSKLMLTVLFVFIQ